MDRPFAKWAGEQIGQVCLRNDNKGPWETAPPEELYIKIHEEFAEMVEAYWDWIEDTTEENMEAMVWELHDVAATCLMMSARLDSVMSGLRRGQVRGREFPE